MGICLCCGRRGAYYGCDCRPGWCEGCGSCAFHCRCHPGATGEESDRPGMAEPALELDDPSGPFAGLGEIVQGGRREPGNDGSAGADTGGATSGRVGGPARRPFSPRTRRADDLLARLDRVTPADGDEMCSLFLERGWVEAVRHFARGSMLTPAGVREVGLLLAASNEWADGLPTDVEGTPPEGVSR